MPVRRRIRPRWAALPAVVAAALLAGCASVTAGTPVSLGQPAGSGAVGSSPASGGSSAPTTSASTTAAARSAASTSAASNGGDGGGKVSTTCPSAAKVGALVGATFPSPVTNSAGGSSVCDYNNTSTGASVVIVISPSTPGLSPALLKTVVADAAKAQKVTNLREVSGLGEAAWEFTQPDTDTELNHTPTTFLEVLTATNTIAITGPVKPSAIEAVARLVVSN